MEEIYTKSVVGDFVENFKSVLEGVLGDVLSHRCVDSAVFRRSEKAVFNGDIWRFFAFYSFLKQKYVRFRIKASKVCSKRSFASFLKLIWFSKRLNNVSAKSVYFLRAACKKSSWKTFLLFVETENSFHGERSASLRKLFTVVLISCSCRCLLVRQNVPILRSGSWRFSNCEAFYFVCFFLKGVFDRLYRQWHVCVIYGLYRAEMCKLKGCSVFARTSEFRLLLPVL